MQYLIIFTLTPPFVWLCFATSELTVGSWSSAPRSRRFPRGGYKQAGCHNNCCYFSASWVTLVMSVGLWWSLRKRAVLGFHISTNHFHWAPRCSSGRDIYNVEHTYPPQWSLLWRWMCKTGAIWDRFVATWPHTTVPGPQLSELVIKSAASIFF